MSGLWRHPFRFLLRFAEFLIFPVRALAHFFFCVWLPGSVNSRAARAAWLHRWACVSFAIFRGRVEVKGTLPVGGILASNHLGYIDILALGSLQPCSFVSKAEVRSWPIFGWLAAAGGTLFIRRDRRSDVADVSRQFAPFVEEKIPLVMFLEGTSTGGDHLLPFKPSLLEPVVAGGWGAVPVWIGYTMDDGVVHDELAYWRDMTLVPHLLNLLSKRGFTAHIAFGEPISALDRKELARRLQQRVCELAAQFGRTVTVGTQWHQLPAKPEERN